MQSTDIDFFDLVQNIFTNEPKPAHSICVQFDYDGNDKDSVEFLFKQLTVAFTEGMKIKYGNSNGVVDLETLQESDFLKIKQYFNSFGIDVNYTIRNKYTDKYLKELDNIDELPDLFDDKNNVKKESNELKDYFLNLEKNDMVYKISFDFLELH